jgi:hypothetical protein
MKKNRHFIRLSLVLLFLMVAVLGCTTTDAIKKAVSENNAVIAGIVAENNAAMIVDPSIHSPNEPIESNEAWRDPVVKMDRIIEMNPNLTTLINHLRVRQAVVLTVYGQHKLAERRWEIVNPGELKNERDSGLWENRAGLVWAYKRLREKQHLDGVEIKAAQRSMNQLDETIRKVDNHDFKVYLSTVRAQIALKVNNSADPRTKPEMMQWQSSMVADLKGFVEVFSELEKRWVQNNPNTNIANNLTVNEIRNSVWLREGIRNFRETAENDSVGFSDLAREFDLPVKPAWEPGWIKNLDFN